MTHPDPSELVPMDVPSRSRRLVESFDGAEIDALLVTNLTNIRYLTGFTGSAALLLVTAAGMTFVSDGRYGEQASAQIAGAGVDAAIEITNTAQKDPLVSAAAAAGASRIGLEADDVSWSAATRYADEWFTGGTVTPTEGLIAGLRMIKDDGELERLAAAAAIADAALASVRDRLAEGPTESEFAIELDMAMRRLGAEDVSFDTIVASGPNGALPHHHPGHRRITEGDLVVCDFGALLDGYHSDMTRTFMIGEPSPTQARMYEVVQEAQAAGVAAVEAGVDGRDVDAACREIIAAAGWEDAFVHGTGHGVGLDIHEEPRVSKVAAATLADRCVVTVEPGVYLPEHGGVRIEDTVIVTPDGARPITLTPKTAAV